LLESIALKEPQSTTSASGELTKILLDNLNVSSVKLAHTATTMLLQRKIARKTTTAKQELNMQTSSHVPSNSKAL